MPQERTEYALYASEVMPIIKSLVVADTRAELQKAVEDLYAAYPEVVSEYLEWSNPHKFPGKEKPHGAEDKDVTFSYEQQDKKAPQHHEEAPSGQDYQPTIEPKPHLKKLVTLHKASQLLKPGPGHDHPAKLESKIEALRGKAPTGRDPDEFAHRVAYSQTRGPVTKLAALARIAKQPTQMPAAAPAATGAERRLCPRCGGAPCYCPGEGSAGEKSMGGPAATSETKEAIVMDREDLVPQSPPDRPLKGGSPTS